MNDAKQLQTIRGHNNDVTALDFAADLVLATASGDKTVRVWRWRTGQGYVEASFSPLLAHKYAVTSVKVSPRSTMLASAGIDGYTFLWNLRTGAKIRAMLQTAAEAVRVCQFSPDSMLLATAGDNGQVCIWDLVRHDLTGCFRRHEGAVRALSFSPDSTWLVTACTFGVLRLFSTADFVHVETVDAFARVDDAHDLGVTSSDFSPSYRVSSDLPFAKSYRLVTCGNDRCVKLWKIDAVRTECDAPRPFTAEIFLCRVMKRHSSALTCVRFNSNGLYVASASLDKTTIIWEASTGKATAIISGHDRYVACCAFSKDGSLLATGSNDKSVIVWDLTGNLCLDSELPRRFISASSLSDDREENVEYERDVMRRAETSSVDDARLIRKLEHTGAINGVTFYGNRLVATGSGDKLVRVWSVEIAEGEEAEEDGDDSAAAVKFQKMLYSPLDGHKYGVNHVEFSPCGSMLASCSLDGTTVIWDTTNGCQKRSFFANSGSGVRICRWSPDGTKIATAGDDEKTTLWDVNDTEELCVFRGHSDAVNAIAFTSDSRYLVTACNGGTWRLFDVIDDDNVALVICEEAHDLGVQGCDFSSTSILGTLAGVRGRADANNDERSYLLATSGNDSLVKLWRITVYGRYEFTTETTRDSNYGVAEYEERKILIGHGGNVTCVRFPPTRGEILGSVATDRTARIWSVRSGSCLYVLEGHGSLVTSCVFSEDASLFVTGALDKTVLIWRIPQRLVLQDTLIDDLRRNGRKVADWRIDDTLKWLNDTGLSTLTRKACLISLNGQQLLGLSEDELVRRLEIEQDEETAEVFKTQLYWLKREDNNTVEIFTDDANVPHEFLCPITREIMKEPVRCSDGFTYERAAINEWFLCGKYTSPMTNEPLQNTSFMPNVVLRNAIYTFLHGNRPRL